MELGYYVEGEMTICEKCSFNPMYNLLTTEIDMEVEFPDGFTCQDCGDTVGVPEDWEQPL